MRSLLVFTAVLCAGALGAQGSRQEPTYLQLFSTCYPTPKPFPEGIARPRPIYDFVDKSKLPAGAKLSSAARTRNGVIWIVTDSGAYFSEGGSYKPLTQSSLVLSDLV